MTLDEDDIRIMQTQMLMAFRSSSNTTSLLMTSPSPELVSYVQAAFLNAMECNEGKMTLEMPTSLNTALTYVQVVSILMALQARCTMPVIKQDLYGKAILMVLYFIWISPRPYLGLFGTSDL